MGKGERFDRQPQERMHVENVKLLDASQARCIRSSNLGCFCRVDALTYHAILTHRAGLVLARGRHPSWRPSGNHLVSNRRHVIQSLVTSMCPAVRSQARIVLPCRSIR